jgi:hypothetical protein
MAVLLRVDRGITYFPYLQPADVIVFADILPQWLVIDMYQ